jgi:MFS family permease
MIKYLSVIYSYMTDLPIFNSKEKENGKLAALSLASLGHFVNDGTMFFFPLIIAVFASSGSFSPVVLTALLAVFYITASLFSLAVGRLSQLIHRYGILISAGFVMMALGLGIFYFVVVSPDKPFASVLSLVASFAMGAGSAFYHPLGAAVLQNRFKNRDQGKALGINGAMGSLGRSIYPYLFFAIAVFTSMSGSFIVFAAVAIISASLILFRLKDRSEPNVAVDQGTTVSQKKSTVSGAIILLTVITFIRTTASQGIASWMPTYLSSVEGYGITTSLGLALSIMYASAILGQPLFGILADRYDRRMLLSLSSVGTAMSVLGILFIGGFANILFLMLFGFFTFSGFPLLFSIISSYASKTSSSMNNSIVWGFGSQGGMAAGPIIAGSIILDQYQRLTLSFEVFVILSLIAAVLVFTLPKTQKRGKMALFG